MSNIFHAPYTVTQNYGCTGLDAEPQYGECEHFHPAVDVVGPSNTCPIYAAVPGKVYACGRDTDGALYVIERADDNRWHIYWHLSNITVDHGQRIDTSTQIGNQGNTGHVVSSKPGGGYHCHYGVYVGPVWLGLKNPLTMTPINPMPFLQDNHPIGGQDMEPHQLARDLYQAFTATIPGDDIINQKADYITGTNSCQQVAKDIASAGGWKSGWDWNLEALRDYDAARGGADPNKFALDHLQAGVTFDAVIKSDLPSYIAGAKQAQQRIADLEQQLAQASQPAPVTPNPVEPTQTADPAPATPPAEPVPAPVEPPVTPISPPTMELPTKSKASPFAWFWTLIQALFQGGKQ
jgi:hypothetical protein